MHAQMYLIMISRSLDARCMCIIYIDIDVHMLRSPGALAQGACLIEAMLLQINKL